MLYNNCGLDTYTALVLLEVLRQRFAPEYHSPEPLKERESLLGRACRALARRFHEPEKRTARRDYENITSLRDAYCRVQGGQGRACACPEPVTETCVQREQKKAV